MPSPATAKWPKPTSEDEFENIVLDALKVRWNDPHASRHGRRGQAQYGVDIFGHAVHLGKALAAAQCKNTEHPTAEQVIEEARRATEFVPPIAEFLFVTSANRDVHLQENVRLRMPAEALPFPVHLMFWEDVVQEIAGRPELVHKHWPPVWYSEASAAEEDDISAIDADLFSWLLEAALDLERKAGDRLADWQSFERDGFPDASVFRPDVFEESVAVLAEQGYVTASTSSMGLVAVRLLDEGIFRFKNRRDAGYQRLVIRVAEDILDCVSDVYRTCDSRDISDRLKVSHILVLSIIGWFAGLGYISTNEMTGGVTYVIGMTTSFKREIMKNRASQ